MKTKVTNMTSEKTGKGIPNQYIIDTKSGKYFQSYDSVIAFRPYNTNKHIELDKTYWNYSATTGRYRNTFLGEAISETRKKINSGEYILTGLN